MTECKAQSRSAAASTPGASTPGASTPGASTPGVGHPVAGGRTRGSGVRTVYESLRQDILNMRLAPGEPLDETRLSARFQLSRTPIREAMVWLASEGLATTLPNRNTIVSVIDFAAMPAYLDALTLMYRVTCRLAAQRRTAADVEELGRLQAAFATAVAETDAIAMIDANRELHLAIARTGRNSYYSAFFTKLLDEGQRLLRLYYWSFDDRLPQQYVGEHDAIIAAIDRGDADAADRLGSEHAIQVVDQIRSFLASGVGREVRLSA